MAPSSGQLATVSAACVVAALWFAATALSATSVDYEIPGAATGAMVFLGLNLYFLITAARRIRSSRDSADRRASARLTVSLAGRLDGVPCEIVDLSLTGAAVIVNRPHDLTESAARLRSTSPQSRSR